MGARGGGVGRRHAAALTAAALLALLPGPPALADVVHSTTYRQHPVSGSTAASVVAHMRAHPIIDPDDGAAFANITHDHDLAVRTAMAGGTCRVSDLTFRWRFVITVPKAVDYGKMDARTRSMWNQAVAAFKGHEETHRSIFLRCAAKFVPAAERLTAANCAALRRKVGASIDRAYQACFAAHRAFEQRDRPRILALPLFRAARSQ